MHFCFILHVTTVLLQVTRGSEGRIFANCWLLLLNGQYLRSSGIFILDFLCWRFISVCPMQYMALRPSSICGQDCEFKFGAIFAKFPLNILKKRFFEQCLKWAWAWAWSGSRDQICNFTPPSELKFYTQLTRENHNKTYTQVIIF